MVKLEATFETNVPVPVVTIETPEEMPSLAPGESIQIDATVTNHGMIAAEDVELLVPETTRYYTYHPATAKLGTLPAKSSITVPVTVERILIPQAVHR